MTPGAQHAAANGIRVRRARPDDAGVMVELVRALADYERGFYRHLGARPQDDWTAYRRSGLDLNRLGVPAEDPGAANDGQIDVSRPGVTESYSQE